ncbi:MAG: large conductance mechanosensitive channel protein MscL [Clostridia bacterium]|nr:large conductance mechanosensitive channel protein MscL [Clostridia bacterium]
MKKFFKEFKEFAMRGNVIDMAVGIIIGAAFKAIVDSLIANFIQPLLNWILPAPAEAADGAWAIGPACASFIGTIISFILTAFVLFLIIKAMNAAKNAKKKEEAPAEPTTKKCPFCLSEIDISATRCPHCTSELKE